MDIAEIVALTSNLSPLVLAIIAIVIFYRGGVVPQTVVESIVVQTTTRVLAACAKDNEHVVAEISARIVAAIDAMLDEHEQRILRELDRKPVTGPLNTRRHL